MASFLARSGTGTISRVNAHATILRNIRRNLDGELSTLDDKADLSFCAFWYLCHKRPVCRYRGQSADQKIFQEQLEAASGKYILAYSIDDVISAL